MKSNKIKLILIIIFPFIFLLPFTLQFIDVGNDFELYYFSYKKYIFELLKNGNIPLWSPAEAAGYSLIFNPLTQFFYLPSWFHYLISFFYGDLTKYSFLIYTISAISIFNIGLYKFLKTFKIDSGIIISVVIITSISLKLTELLRFPNALHAFAWFPWILYGINSIYINHKPFNNFLIIFISSFMIFTAGYPYYIVYGFILFVLYIIFLLLISRKNFLFKKKDFKAINKSKFILNISFPSICSAIIFSPIYLKTSQLMNITRGRNTSDIDFSLHGSSNLYDQIGSWIYPPFSMAEGWYYFGAVPIFIIISIAIVSFLNNTIHDHEKTSLKVMILFFFVLFLINYQFSNSKDSLIFIYFWKLIEPIQNFRFWIRINIILVPFISILLAFSLQYLFKILNNFDTSRVNRVNTILICSFTLILFTQFYFINYSDYKNFYWDTWQTKRIDAVLLALPSFLSNIIGLYKSYIYSIFFIIIFFILIVLFNNRYFLEKFKKQNNLFLYLIVVLTCCEMFFISNIQWAIPHKYYENGFVELNLKKNYNSPNNNAEKDLINALNSNRVTMQKSLTKGYHGNTYYRHNKKFNINYINHWGNNNHTFIFDKYFYNNGTFREELNENNKKTVSYFFGIDNKSRKFFYSSTINHIDIDSYVKDTLLSEKKDNFIYDVSNYDGDILEINVNVKKNGWFSFIDTWDPNWKAYVNYKEVNIEKLFGAYKSIRIKEGSNKIKFEYKPFNLNFNK